MEFELVIFLVMLGVFLLGNFLLKLPVSLSMAAGAIAGALVGGGRVSPCAICSRAPLSIWIRCSSSPWP